MLLWFQLCEVPGQITPQAWSGASRHSSNIGHLTLYNIVWRKWNTWEKNQHLFRASVCHSSEPIGQLGTCWGMRMPEQLSMPAHGATLTIPLWNGWRTEKPILPRQWHPAKMQMSQRTQKSTNGLPYEFQSVKVCQKEVRKSLIY